MNKPSQPVPSAPDRDDPFKDMVEEGMATAPTPPIIRYEGWQNYVETPVAVRPPMPTLSEFGALSASAKRSLGTLRKRYHAKFGPIETAMLSDIHDETLRLAALNYSAAPGARPGVVLNGLGTVGKSTIAIELGRKYERSLRKKLKLPISNQPGPIFVPVIYVTLPGNNTVSAFNALIIHFLGLPVRKSAKESELTESVVDGAMEARTSMIIVDDIHFLRMKNRTFEYVNNHLKYLASAISATFVYAGINVEGAGLFSEGASKESEIFSQTQHRFKKYDLVRYKKGSEEFKKLLKSFDAHLLLLKHEPDTLVRLESYIHDRTNGFIGAVSNLVREGANIAIETKVEQITQTVLDSVRLDKAAEEHRAVLRPKKAK